MFDIGAGELLVIAVVALVVIGPKELPAVLRQAGKFTNKMRQMAGEFRSQFDEAMRESELHEAKKQIANLNPLNTIQNQIHDIDASLNAKIDGSVEQSGAQMIAAPVEITKPVKKRMPKANSSITKTASTPKKSKSTKQASS
jgi:sec-independent protein translocase protein TatB